MIWELVAAGICGGHPRQVEKETGLRDYMLLQQHWVKWGAPLYISAAAYLGHKVGQDKPETESLCAAQHFDELQHFFNG